MYVALLILTVLVYALVVAVYLRHRAASWFHPLTIYLAFHGLVFVLRPILSWYYGYTFIYQLYLFSPDEYAKDMTLVAVNLGLVSFAFASLRWGNAPLGFGADRAGRAGLSERADRADRATLSALALPLWLISLPLLPLVAYSLNQAWTLRGQAGGSLELDRATGIAVNVGSGNGYVQVAYFLAAVLLPLLAWVGRFRPWWLVAVAATAALIGGSGTRGPIISMLVCLATLYLYDRRRRAPDWRIVLIAATGVIGFNAVGANRGEEVRALFGNQSDATTTQMADQLSPLEGMDLGSLEFVEYLVDKVPRDTRSYEYFVDNLQVFTEPVPRVLWRDKPIGQPIRFFSLFDYGYPIGMTRSMPGEGWTQLGLVGVVLWCALCGAGCGAIYNRFALGSRTPVQVAFYAAFLSTLIVFYRDGLLVTLLRQGLFFVVPPVLWWLAARLMGVRTRATDPAAADLRLPGGQIPRSRRKSRRDGAMRDDEAVIAAQTPEPEPEPEPDPAEVVLPRSRRHPRRPAPPGSFRTAPQLRG